MTAACPTDCESSRNPGTALEEPQAWYDIQLEEEQAISVMGQIIIRNIDDRVLARLRARAASQQKSLDQSLRDLLAEAAKPDRAELLSQAERIRAMTPSQGKNADFPTAEALVRESRDAR